LAEWKTKAVCVGGGGESLLNEHTSHLLNKLVDLGIDVGVVTNGTHIPQHLPALARCKWVAISMDAGTKETYMKMKGIKADKWDEVMGNIKKLAATGIETTWKFLVHPDNFNELYDACKMAKSIGCSIIHIRPGSHTWFSSFDDKSFQFPQNAVQHAKEQIARAREEFQDDTFRIYAVEDKFNSKWGVKKSFSKCYAVFTNCFIDSNGSVGLCCDRKGDPHLMLGNMQNIRAKWGSEDHWKIHENIRVSLCPRCTLIHVNEIFENVILEDKMFYNMF
jgi:MoaA/NifB/PqqE/SkfB family radical SAM enzyme